MPLCHQKEDLEQRPVPGFEVRKKRRTCLGPAPSNLGLTAVPRTCSDGTLRQTSTGGFPLDSCLHGAFSPCSQGLDMTDVLPPCITEKILLLLPPRTLASACALVSSRWSKLCCSQDLWKEICQPSGLRDEDAASVLGSWRGLYGLAFGTNLLHSACFESVERSWFRSKDSGGHIPSRPFQTYAQKFVDHLAAADEIDQGYRNASHWAEDKDRTLPANVNAASIWGRNHYVRTVVPPSFLCQPAEFCSNSRDTCSRPPASEDCIAPKEANDEGQGRQDQGFGPSFIESGRTRGFVDSLTTGLRKAREGSEGCPPPEGSCAIQMSDNSWGMLKQCVSLGSFSSSFLDRSPSLRVTAWYRCSPAENTQITGASEVGGNMRLQAFLRTEAEPIPFALWDSGELCCLSQEWQHFSGEIQNYPAGLRLLHMRVSGKGVLISKVSVMFNNGFHANTI